MTRLMETVYTVSSLLPSSSSWSSNIMTRCSPVRRQHGQPPTSKMTAVSAAATVLLFIFLLVDRCGSGCHAATSPGANDDVTEQVDLDLLNGIVKGYSRYVEFIVAPTPTKNRTCSAQAVVRVDLTAPGSDEDEEGDDANAIHAGRLAAGDHARMSSGRVGVVSSAAALTFNRVRLILEYERAPRLWTVDVADSYKADGYGTPDFDGRESSFSETQIFNEQLRIYGNSLPGHREASVDGGHLLKVVDAVVGRKQNNQLVLDISDGRVEWRQAKRGGQRGTGKQSIESRFLYQLNRGRHNRTPIVTGNVTEANDDDDDEDVVDVDDDEEEDDSGAVYIGFNRVVAGNFRSGSGLCRAVVQLFADTVDYCRHGDRSQCHVDAECYNVSRSHRCRCKEGFHGNGKTCSDVNECDSNNGGCVHFCRNSHGGYNCSCFSGFRLDTQNGGHNCIDINECQTNKGGCEHECVNLVGSFECRCKNGYFLASNGKNCVAANNWCREHLGCAHHCHSTALGTKCICRRGFRLQANGKDCIATCSHGNGGCQHRCVDRHEGAICSCHDNYVLRDDRKTCKVTCALNNGGCERRCDDTPEGPVCSCPPGFMLDQKERKICFDVDECSAGDRGGCSHECVNSKGSYECSCPSGFRLAPDGRTCHDINECAWNDTCDHICTNTEGSYSCSCQPGHEIYGGTHCADKNECSVNNGGCEHRCENTQGSYRCECHPGYRLHPNKYDCVEAVRCPALRAPAKATLDCSTEVGSGGTELLACRLSCHSSSQFPAVMALTPGTGTIMTRCGAQTGFRWSHELQNITLLSCSDQILAPGYKGRAKFMFFAEQCRVRRKNLVDFERQLSPLIVGKSDSCENDMCSVTFVDLKCDTRKRKFRHLVGGNTQTLMSAEFEMKVKPATPTDMCGVECARTENLKRLRRSIKRLREIINNNREKFAIQYEGKNYEVLKRSLRAYKPRDVCEPGQVLTNNRCVACSLATWFNQATGLCEPCPAGTYQDKEGQLSCVPCPHRLYGVGVEGAKSVSECGEVCNPGSYSFDGLTPCRLCPIGTYQSDYGRTLCLQCGPGIITRAPGSTGFQDCLVNEHCRPGEYYSRQDERCIACPRDTYQPMAGQLYCIDCPGETQTDTEGAISNLQCKDRACKGNNDNNRGFIQSPNWPGLYPANIECTWRINPEHGRRILVIVPEIHIAAQDHCRDSLVMRQSASPYSLTTYEECSSSSSPVAFSARSQSLWIYFKTDAINSDKGFSIPFVTYSEEYQELIDDIVRDGRLYLSHQHQEVLKNGKLLSALLDVIAQPYTYYKYANVSQSVLPDSFVRLLRDKVVRFFS